MASLVINTMDSAKVIANIQDFLWEEFRLPCKIIDYNELCIRKLRQSFDIDDLLLSVHADRMKSDNNLVQEFLKSVYPVDVNHDSVKIIVGKVSQEEWAHLKQLGAYMVSDKYIDDADAFVYQVDSASFPYQLVNILEEFVRMDWVYRYPSVRSTLRDIFKKAVIL